MMDLLRADDLFHRNEQDRRLATCLIHPEYVILVGPEGFEPPTKGL
jgi:hypothetical protein